MINATELRMGNCIEDLKTGLPVIVTPYLLCEIYVNGRFHSPSPLTPEILIKCESKSGLGLIDLCDKIIKDDGTIQLFYNPFDKQLIQRNPNIALYCPTIKTLHQLQNLYYTLTGKELTYTP